jgi:hypothetical protein
LAEARGDSEEAPEGYEENNGRVDILVPVQDGYHHPAKWVQRLDDGRVALLTGLCNKEEPYIADLYASPNHNNNNPINALPSWFMDYLVASAPTYNILKEAVAQHHNWAYLAEVERYRRLDKELGELNNELRILQAKRGWVEERLSTCQGRMEGARIPARVGHLERQYPPSQIGKRMRRFTKKPWQDDGPN